MPVLVTTFRWLLKEVEPGLESHLHSVGFSPAECAMKWMASGFVNVLDVEEVRSAAYLFWCLHGAVDYHVHAVVSCHI